MSEVVGLNIRAKRRALGLTQEEAGRRLGRHLGTEPWSKVTWSTVETPVGGNRRLRRLDPDDLAAIATVLETTVTELFGDPGSARCPLCPGLHRWLRREGLRTSGEQGV
jgi:transcriptional regulator with XRE-family HTH domain